MFLSLLINDCIHLDEIAACIMQEQCFHHAAKDRHLLPIRLLDIFDVKDDLLLIIHRQQNIQEFLCILLISVRRLRPQYHVQVEQ